MQVKHKRSLQAAPRVGYSNALSKLACLEGDVFENIL